MLIALFLSSQWEHDDRCVYYLFFGSLVRFLILRIYDASVAQACEMGGLICQSS